MVYGYRCFSISRHNHFTTSVEMRFFWLPLLTMNCNEEPFTYIYEWKRCSPSFGSLVSFFWIFVVAIVELGFAPMICFPFSLLLLGYDSESKHAYDLEVFSLANSDCLAQQSLVLWLDILWNSHHFIMPLFVFVVFSLLSALMGFPRSPRLGFHLWYVVSRCLFLALDL